MMDRVILHSDLNCFYASVEMMLNPALRGKAVAVCGSTEDRHGIVLAKSELAKRSGVKTGMVNWEARQRCPGLIVVPPQYDQYLKYSALTRAIYARFTNLVEPFGMDECWLDITGLPRCGNGVWVAENIRQMVKEELGLTVSIGVSFNKIFAKLGSDMKKPDAITQITRDCYREKVWPLPVGELLYVGRATEAKLARYGIKTIGDLAACSPDFLQRLLGLNGLAILSYAQGTDTSRVMPQDFVSPVKSIGHGITCNADLENEEEAWKVMLELSQDIGHRLRVHNLVATGVQISVRSGDLSSRQYQRRMEHTSRSPMELAETARTLLHANYNWGCPIRAITVRAINLLPFGQPEQVSMFVDPVRLERRDRLETAIEDLRRRFGKKAVFPATLMGDLKMPDDGRDEVIMPGLMYS